MSSVLSPNRVLLSAAGSGKTTLLVRQALERPQRRIAMLTYTLENLEEIRRSFEAHAGAVPANVTLYSWYGFLLRECIRPYQAALCREPRVESIQFVEGRTNNRAPRSQISRHYLAGDRMYSDRASDFAVRCDELTHGQVISRLADMYDEVYVDEVQDLAGYDLDLIERLLKSPIGVTLVGDTRQATYATNYAPRYSQFRGPNLATLFQLWESHGLCQIDHRLTSLRCVQALCDLADALYPQMPRTQSGNDQLTGHDGIYLVAPEHVTAYMQEFAPTVLRHDRRQACDGLPAMNFGQSKGRTYSRVLIFPNGPLTQYLRTADASRITAPPKYYVAFTRARQSVAFVYNGTCALLGHQLYTPQTQTT
ncbi:TPA: UvrD-helicase domain-containing protein [Stenotrophomonas maltophilia]|nr:UvrD-helicase domain-containing protein [Stenotrophomonas maltophilia]HDS1638837.1 UvrD-helicase domain-containing protein [Stenotrophomonas maltophilia]